MAALPFVRTYLRFNVCGAAPHRSNDAFMIP
jgi:hypothetical protein